jgi:putative phage-type endonuclease
MELNDDQRRDAWLTERREMITSTDLAAIMHLPGAFGSPMRVWLDKTGRAERSQEVPEEMIWGQRLQQAILVGYSEREGCPVELVDEYTLFRSPTCDRLGASLDARVQSGDRRPVDAKNIGYMDPEKWGEPYSSDVPAAYVMQLHGQMEVLGTPIADLAALFGGRKLVVYRVPRDEEIVAAAREAAVDFWDRYVKTDTPPPVDASDDWTRFLRSRAQKSDAYLDVKTMEQEAYYRAVEAVEMLQSAKKDAAETEEEEALCANRVRAIIGDHAGLIVPGMRVHYKQNKPSKKIDWEAIVRHLTCRADAEMLQHLIDEYTTEKPGNRPLILKTAKEAKKD